MIDLLKNIKIDLESKSLFTLKFVHNNHKIKYLTAQFGDIEDRIRIEICWEE